MEKAKRYALRVLICAGILFVLLWVIIWGYIRYNKADLIKRITGKITEKTKAEATIGDLTASVLQTFPFISVQLSDVVIKDSLWRKHDRTFFAAKNLYLRLSPFGLFNKNKGVGKVIVDRGKLHLFVDSIHFNNQYIMRADKQGRKNGNSPVPQIYLKNSEVVIENPSRQKFHHFSIRRLELTNTEKKGLQYFEIDTDLLVKSLAFNTSKGSYLKNKNVQGAFQVSIDRGQKQLAFSNISLLIDAMRFNLTGNFSLDTSKRGFKLAIHSPALDFKRTVQLLPDSMQRKLNSFSMSEPIKASIEISGETRYRFVPLVQIVAEVRNNTITTQGGTFTNSSFTGKFNNELKVGDPRLDMNSVLEVIDFSTEFEKIPIKSRRIKLSNLKSPYLECDIRSSFDLSSLNDLTGSSTLQFSKGKGDVDLVFKGPISGRDSVESGIDGFIKITNATVKYLPRNFTLSQCRGTVVFREKDLLVQKFEAKTGQTEITMNGDAKNFLSLLDISPEKLTLHWNVYSPFLHLKDFTNFLAKRNISSSQKGKNNNFKKAAGNIDKMFTEGDVFVTLSSPQMDYKKFDAKKVNAELLLTDNMINLKNVSFGHADGSMKMWGTITEGARSNAVLLNATLNKMDIPTLFSSFSDFGQDAVTHKNLKGIVSATVNVNTAITDQAQVLPESMEGTIDFLVEGGELNHFEPFEKISASVFKKQDFSSIRFADLKNRLQVKGTAIIIDKMEIRSTALVLFAEGVYDVKKGTDMSIKFPIRNVLRKNDSIDLISSDIKHGVTVMVRAKTGEDGKLKISWDPFRRSRRNKKEAEANK